MLFAQLFMAFVILTPLAFITGQTTFHNSLVGWSSLLFQAVIVSYASYLVWNFLLKQYLAARPRGARLHDPDLRRHSLGAPPWRIGSACRLSSGRFSCLPASFSCRRRQFCWLRSTVLKKLIPLIHQKLPESPAALFFPGNKNLCFFSIWFLCSVDPVRCMPDNKESAPSLMAISAYCG